VAGPVQDAEGPVAQRQLGPVGERHRHGALRAPRAERARHRAQRDPDVVRHTVAAHELLGEAVVGLHAPAVLGQPRRERVDGGHLGARAAREDLDEPDVVHVLVGQHDELEVLDAAAVRGQRPLELVERLAAVGPRVDQRQRVVLDEVDVDPSDRERGRDGKRVDQERMRSSTSSRRRSMSSRETSDSRFRRSSGSVLEGRTLKCQSS
jgi:hypothetical protein